MHPRKRRSTVSRREFIATSTAVPMALAASSFLYPASMPAATAPRPTPASDTKKNYPIGIELYAVREELKRDLPGTLRRVAEMGYQCVEFYAPYFQWTFPYAKEVRTQLDDLGLRCFSTHNHVQSFTPGETMAKAIELNQILGCRHLVMSSPPPGTNGLEGWKRACGIFATAAAQLAPHGLAAGFHNHQTEWRAIDGAKRIMDLIAESTPKEFVLQLDVGTCLEAGADPIAWIKANPGRIKSVHLKDWAPGRKEDEKGYRVLFGEGAAPWTEIFAAAESVGGVEYYLMEQEGSRYPEFETAERCLATWKKMRG